MDKPRIKLAPVPDNSSGLFRTWECAGLGVTAWGITPYVAWLHWHDHSYAVREPVDATWPAYLR